MNVYGLALGADFDLPGLGEPGGEAADLELLLAGAAELAAVFSGAAAAVAETRLGDGRRWVVRRGRAGDLRMDCDGLAAFHLDAGATRLLCAPVDVRDPAWRRVLLGGALATVALERGATALHAGAVLLGPGVVALAGPPGAGKSTLGACLVKRGGRLVADDVAVLDDRDDRVCVHPAAGMVSVPAGTGATLGRVVAGFGDEDWVEVAGAVREPAPLAAVVVLARDRAGPARPVLAEAADPVAALLEHALPVATEGERRAAVIAAICAVADQARVGRLQAAADVAPAELAAAVEAWVGG